MKTLCPHCHQIYDVEENLIGMELQCSVCQQIFIAAKIEPLSAVPSAILVSDPAQQIPPAAAKSSDCGQKVIRWFKEKCRNLVEVDTFCPHCHQKYELPKQLLNTQVTCTNCNQKFFVKKSLLCPSCQNICLESDEICRFCGTNIKLFEMDKHKSTLKEKDEYNDYCEEEIIIEESFATKGGLETYCSHCYQKYELPKNLLNTQVTCTNCNQKFLVKKWQPCSSCGTLNPESNYKCSKCQLDFSLEEMNKHKSTFEEEEQYTPALWKNCLFVPVAAVLIIVAPYVAVNNFSFFAIPVWVSDVTVCSGIFLLLSCVHILPFFWIVIARKLNPHWAFKVIYPIYKTCIGVQCIFLGLSVCGCFNLLDTYTLLGVLITEISSIISGTLQVCLFSISFPYKTPHGTFTKNIVSGLTVGAILFILGLIGRLL